jgi:hypothetical protein
MTEPVSEAILRRRADIGDALSAVERALATASGAGTSWPAHVAQRIRELTTLVEQQVVAYNADDGVFADLVHRSPRLAPAVRKMRAVLDSFGPRLEELSAIVHTAPPEEVRETALALLGDIVRARQKIADLVWDAWSIDLGGTSS